MTADVRPTVRLAPAHPGEADLLDWLLGDALPLWAERGPDRVRGGFHEKLTRDGEAVDQMRRSRLVARQVYCFATAHALGWDGPARALVEHGLDYLTSRLLTPAGRVMQACSADGSEVDARHDPYNYAFVLLALASAGELAGAGRTAELAARVTGYLVDTWAHPRAGFEDGEPRGHLLRANPHMHLLEAFLAWSQRPDAGAVAAGEHAAALVGLALHHLLDPDTGALPELYDGSWRPHRRRGALVVEPGHQFEWSWLLGCWAASAGPEHADAPRRDDAHAAAVALADLGERRGIDAGRGVAVNQLLLGGQDDGRVLDAAAKVWPQTERLKCSRAVQADPTLSEHRRAAAGRHAHAAATATLGFLLPERPGLWHEVMLADGTFVDEPVRASTLYHLVCAVHTVTTLGPATTQAITVEASA